MMCEQAELRMAELLAGEILPAERAALEQHLLDCGSCRGDFELARVGVRIEWADVAVPKEVVDATLASFREPPALVRVLRWATAAAAVFGVAVLLVSSSRAPAPVVSSAAVPIRRAPQRELLATMQDAVVGALVCKDEEGRPVGELGLKSHEVSVEILDGIAKTTVEENFENHTNRRLEGTFNFPLPSDASISRLALEVNGKIEEGTCLERERAREVFESIVRKMQDPALLEWQPGGFFKCRVFPIEPRSTKRVIVAYTQALPCFQGKMTYVYPLASEKTRAHPPEEVRIAVQARFSGALAKIESPSHHLDVQRKSPNEASMAFRAAHYRPNNDFVVTMEPADEEVRVVSHKPEGEDGYFACFVTPRGGGARAPGRYAFVLDVSASISAPRLEVAKRLVRAMMEKGIPGDRFEILAHHIDVERSGEVGLRAANDFMDRLRPIGGSDVLKALQAAGDAEVIYIGKGSPSFGESDPSKILEAVKGRRIRTIAVGSDANGLLLEKLGGMMRVNPNDDVPKRVAEIAATLGSPVLTDLKVEGEGISEVVGLRDLFYGERRVVSGRYGGSATKLLIVGSGWRREVEVAFPAKEEANNYVRRLWAQRRVSDLLAQGAAKKPEVTALGVKYQIMTPYTSFLVLETEQMWKDFQLQREVQKQDQVLGAGDRKPVKPLREGEASEKPVVVVEPPAPMPVKPVPVKTPERTGKSIEIPDSAGQEDPKAKAIREAYEEQLRRDTQTVTLSTKNATVDQIVDEFRRQKGWNIVIDRKNIPDDYRIDEMRITKENAQAMLDSFNAKLSSQRGNFGTDPSVDELRALLAKTNEPTGLPLGEQAGEAKSKWRDEYLSVSALQKFALVPDAASSLKTLSTAESDFRATDRDWDHVNDFWTSNVADLYTMTSAAQGIEGQTEIKGKFRSRGGRLSQDYGREGLERTIADFPGVDIELAVASKVETEVRELPFKHVEWVAQQGGNVNVAPKKALEAKVTAIAPETGLVVISIGKDDGVLEGDEFTVYRGGDFVAKIVVDRSDRKWAAGKIVLKKADPRLADDVSNHVFVAGPRSRFQVVSAEEDRVRLRGFDVPGAQGLLLAVSRESKFVALVRVGQVASMEFDAQVCQGLAVGRILPGDLARPVADGRAYLAGLPAEVRQDLASRANQRTIRAKMELKE